MFKPEAFCLQRKPKLFFLALALMTSSANALNKYDVMGDWALVEFRNSYPAYNLTIENKDLVGLSGRASLSGQAMTFEVSANYQGSYYWRWATGFYTISGNQAVVSIVGASSESVTLVKPDENTLIATGSDYDGNDYYTYRYVFNRTNKYYEESQVQAEISAAVAAAIAGVKPKYVPIILTN